MADDDQDVRIIQVDDGCSIMYFRPNPVTPADVITHELLLVLNWFANAVRGEWEGEHEGYPPEHYRNQIRAILRRAESL